MDQSKRESARRVLRKIAINVAILGASFTVAMVFAEILVRIVAPQQLVSMRPDIWMPDDSLGWRVRGNVTATINTGERKVTFLTDSLGFRTAANGPHPRGDVNVLLIGDSFMQALQVDYPVTMGAVLEHTLTTGLGRSVTVWNAGVNGWDPDLYLIRARQLLDRASYDALVVMLYIDNDVIAIQRMRVPPRQIAEAHHLRVPHGLSHAELVDALAYPINDFLKTRSHLYQLMKHGFETVLLKGGLSEADFPLVVQRRVANDSMWAVTSRLCGELAAEGTRHHVPVVFGVIPAPYQVDSVAFNYYMKGFSLTPAQVDIDQPQRLLVGALKAKGLTVVDALPAFRAAQSRTNELYGHVDRHFTPKGHALMAEQMARVLMATLAPAARRK